MIKLFDTGIGSYGLDMVALVFCFGWKKLLLVQPRNLTILSGELLTVPFQIDIIPAGWK
jgi:hypothetical protein